MASSKFRELCIILEENYQDLNHEEKVKRIQHDVKRYSKHPSFKSFLAVVREENRSSFGICYLLDVAYYMFDKKRNVKFSHTEEQEYLLELARVYNSLSLGKKTKMIHRIAHEIRKHPLFESKLECLLLKERRKEKKLFGTSFISNLVYYMYN